MWTTKSRAILASLLISLAACTVRLVPDYQPTLVDGLNKANNDTLVLFAALQQGVAPTTYAVYAKRYDVAIGAFSALKTQAEARDVPPLGVSLVDKVKKLGVATLAKVCPDSSDCVNPTPKILDSVIGTLTEVQRVHKQKGYLQAAGSCTPATAAQQAHTGVMFYECAYLEDVRQALFVETSLKRN